MLAARIAVLDDYQDVARSMVDWQAQLPGATVTFANEHLREEDLVEFLRGCAVVVAMRERTPFPRQLMERLPDLRMIVTTGLRNAAIDLVAARERGIVVSGTGSQPWGPSELTWGLILGLLRHIPAEDAALRSGGWQSTVGTGLYGKRLGIVGLGKLGTQVAAVGRAFGMDVGAWSPHLTPARAAEHSVAPLSKEDLFRTSDVVTIHLVLGPGTKGIVGRAELRAMRPDAVLVNTSRGPIVDNAALLTALEERWIAGAALDVFDEEPLPPDHPLRTAPRTVLTPHVGYVTRENYLVYYREAVENIQAFLTGSPIRELTP